MPPPRRLDQKGARTLEQLHLADQIAVERLLARADLVAELVLDLVLVPGAVRVDERAAEVEDRDQYGVASACAR